PRTSATRVSRAEPVFPNWAALEMRPGDPGPPSQVETNGPILAGAVPILFVRHVAAAAEFYLEKLGFQIDFLHGEPPFYGSVSRDRACLHLRFVHQTSF